MSQNINEVIGNKRKYIPKNVMLAIQSFFLCDTFEEEIICYGQNYNDLKECKFLIYSNEVGVDFPDCFKTRLNSNFAIIEIGLTDKYYAIDAQIFEDMLKNTYTNYNLDMCIELDTQVISYLKSNFKSIEQINISDNREDLFYYLSELDVNYSSFPYLIENAKKITKENFQDIYLNLKSFEIFRNFDYRLYIEKGEKKFGIDESNMLINIDNMFNYIKSEKFQREMQDFYEMQEINYCLLLKAIIIENVNSKKSVKNKMELLIDFMNNSLGVFCEREMAICYYYFKHDKNTEKFFRKVKPNSKDIFDAINSMAWDLTHIRLLERLYDFTCVGPVKFGIHPILTYDNGLKDVLKLYPVKKIAIYDGYVIPWFRSSFAEIFPEAKELIHDEYITEKRKYVFRTKNIPVVKKELEKDFMLNHRKY